MSNLFPFQNTQTRINSLSLHHKNLDTEMSAVYGEVRAHSYRVADLCGIFAQLCGLSQYHVRLLEWAGFFHDLGKLSIPPQILHNPSPLSPGEWAIMREHPTAGYNSYLKMCSPNGYNGDVAQAILQHHERVDGSGYPFGLRGTSICPMAQIVSMADTIDAMNSDRCYRKGSTREEIQYEFYRLRDKHWDAQFADLFLNNPRAFDIIFEHEGALTG